MTLLLSRSDIDGLLSMAEVIAAVEAAHAEIARGTAVQPAPAAMTLAPGGATFLAMAALSGGSRLAGAKLLADIPGNAAAGLPVQRSLVVLVSAADGACEAIIHGQIPTRLRTAAASAVATRHLARHEARVLGLIGAGGLAVEHVRALLEVRPIEAVVVWSRTAESAARCAEAIRAAWPRLMVATAANPRAVVAQADIVCTLTPSREPVIEGAWLSPGQHINAVGAPPRADHREIDAAGMARARIVLDSRATAEKESGDLLLAIAEGALSREAAYPELGEVIIGTAPGRTGPADITLFNSVGIAMQDVAIGSLLLARARARGIGTEFDFAR